MNVREIIARGNVHKISEASGEAGRPITVKGIYKWHSIGIPQKHWPVVMRLADVTETELYEANRQLEQDRKAGHPHKCQPQKKVNNNSHLAA